MYLGHDVNSTHDKLVQVPVTHHIRALGQGVLKGGPDPVGQTDRQWTLCFNQPLLLATHFCIISSEMFSRSQRSLILTYASMYTCEERADQTLTAAERGPGHKLGGIKLPFCKTSLVTQVALEVTGSVLVAVATGSPAHQRTCTDWMQVTLVQSLSLVALRKKQEGMRYCETSPFGH